jgi:hypothetical protein
MLGTPKTRAASRPPVSSVYVPKTTAPAPVRSEGPEHFFFTGMSRFYRGIRFTQ